MAEHGGRRPAPLGLSEAAAGRALREGGQRGAAAAGLRRTRRTATRHWRQSRATHRHRHVHQKPYRATAETEERGRSPLMVLRVTEHDGESGGQWCSLCCIICPTATDRGDPAPYTHRPRPEPVPNTRVTHTGHIPDNVQQTNPIKSMRCRAQDNNTHLHTYPPPSPIQPQTPPSPLAPAQLHHHSHQHNSHKHSVRLTTDSTHYVTTNRPLTPTQCHLVTDHNRLHRAEINRCRNRPPIGVIHTADTEGQVQSSVAGYRGR